MRAPEYVRLSTASAMFDTPYETLRAWVRKGALPAKRLGAKSLRVRPEDVRALLVPVVPAGVGEA